MARRLAQLCVALLLASVVSAQIQYCPLFGQDVNWSPQFTPTLVVKTTTGGDYYPGSLNCNFYIKANIPGRVVVQVTRSDLSAYSASISIRTDTFSGYLADWSQLTYSAERHRNFVSITNRLYISFTTRSSPFGLSTGVTMTLTFMRTTDCLPGWTALPLAGVQHCVGRPTASSIYKFGDAQRYCNLQRSNLLVSERDNVTSVLSRVNAVNVWIGMTAEPSGSFSSYRWINNIRVDSNQVVTCSGGCKPATHRCVHAVNTRSLAQIECGQSLQPLCYMPVGGTDVFYAGSAAARASGALLAGAVLLLWSIQS